MFGYLVCSAIFLALFAASLLGWRRKLAGSLLPVAFAIEAAWALASAGRTVIGGAALLASALELLRALAWASVLARCMIGATGARRWAHLLLRTIYTAFTALAAGTLLLFLARDTRLDGYGLALLAAAPVWMGLGLSVLGVVLVEQVARNTRTAQEWQVKYIWLAIGGLFCWDLLLDSMVLLHGGFAATLWSARGFVNALLGALLAVGVRRVEGWRSAAFLSPKLVFFNATLLAAAAYVFAMAAASYFIRSYGGSWGAVGQMVFLAGAALVLVIAVLSEQFRAWLRVTLAKHLFPYRFDYRQEWRKLTLTLSQSDASLPERVVSALGAPVGCPRGGLWLRDGAGDYLPMGGDLASPQAPHEPAGSAFLDFLLQHEWIADLEQARSGREPRVMPRPPEWMLSRSDMRLVVPLICEDALVGFAVLGQPLTPVRLTWEEIDLLRASGRQVAGHLAFDQAAKRLAESRQFEALNRLSAVMMHDLRHLVAQQALVVENAARHRNNPQFFDDAIVTIEHSVKRMTQLMNALRQGDTSGLSERVDLAALCSAAVQRCRDRLPVPTLVAGASVPPALLERDRFCHVLEHIIRNAQDATPPTGSVTVRLTAGAQGAQIEVVDTGSGMDAQFVRDRLFRPFDTTKGERGMGIGAYDAREFIRRCGGEVCVESAPQAGTRFVIRLPAAVPGGSA